MMGTYFVSPTMDIQATLSGTGHEAMADTRTRDAENISYPQLGRGRSSAATDAIR